MIGTESRTAGTATAGTTYGPRSVWNTWARFTLDTAHHDMHAYGVGCAVYVRRNIVFHATPDRRRVYRCESSAKARETFADIISINPAR